MKVAQLLAKLPSAPPIAMMLLLAAAVLACAPQPPQPSTTPAPPASAPTPETLRIALATSDLAVGSNRIVFGIIDAQSGPIRDANVQVSTFYLTHLGEQQTPVQTVDAVFRAWPITPRGVFTAQLEFHRAGEWGIGALVVMPDGAQRKASVRIPVKAESATPAIGAPAPLSISKTLSDVDSLEQITSDIKPDADLYAMTIADALHTGKPLMVAFSTPAYCQTATCGPQLDVIKALKADYSGSVNFIHIEVYDNPHMIEGDLANAVISPTLEEWGLPSEPWTFIVDGEGIISSKFESFTTREELESALLDVPQ